MSRKGGEPLLSPGSIGLRRLDIPYAQSLYLPPRSRLEPSFVWTPIIRNISDLLYHSDRVLGRGHPFGVPFKIVLPAIALDVMLAGVVVTLASLGVIGLVL
ncbi:MAG TPA: hypothetical protein EYP17_06230 [Candidatus Latescibacteria bacterium]|nr:hypothetical protein [Candidatus Latescibacterota bacterium]